MLQAAQLVKQDLPNLLEPRGNHHKPQMLDKELLEFVVVVVLVLF